MIFSFDIANIIERQLPTRKKGARHLDWLFSLLKPLVTSHNKFIAFRDLSRVELSYNSQTKIFEKALNDIADPILRRIFIDNLFDNKTPTFLFNLGEDDPIFLFDISEGKQPTFLFDINEFELDFDFIIFVAIALASEQSRVEALANKLKLTGTRFKIELF